ncbi:MAG: ABC transporter permease, partial [Spirochaetota bacterium]
MGYYVLRRVLQLIPILLGVAFVFFLIFNVVGGNDKFLYSVLPEKGRTLDQIEKYREIYGLNDPWIVQYFRFTRDMFTFNFGISETRKQPVLQLLAAKVPISAVLALPAFFYQVVLALILAMIATHYRGLLFDRTISILAVFGMSLPMLALIILGQGILAYRFQWFPIGGYEPLSQNFWGGLKYFLLPWLLWIAIGLGSNVKFFRTTLLEEINKDYVRTAWAKGQSQWNIMVFHVLRNTLVPILTY